MRTKFIFMFFMFFMLFMLGVKAGEINNDLIKNHTEAFSNLRLFFQTGEVEDYERYANAKRELLVSIPVDEKEFECVKEGLAFFRLIGVEANKGFEYKKEKETLYVYVRSNLNSWLEFMSELEAVKPTYADAHVYVKGVKGLIAKHENLLSAEKNIYTDFSEYLDFLESFSRDLVVSMKITDSIYQGDKRLSIAPIPSGKAKFILESMMESFTDVDSGVKFLNSYITILKSYYQPQLVRGKC